MVISDNPGFIFVHIPKTAGSSITRALRAVGGKKDHALCAKTKHETVESFVERVGHHEFTSRHSFTVIRDPLDRFVSHFRFLKTRGFRDVDHLYSLDEYAYAVESNDPIVCRPARVLPQHKFISLGKDIVVNSVIKYEELKVDTPSIFKELGIHLVDLPHRNVSSYPLEPASRYVREVVLKLYASDYEIFGY